MGGRQSRCVNNRQNKNFNSPVAPVARFTGLTVVWIEHVTRPHGTVLYAYAHFAGA